MKQHISTEMLQQLTYEQKERLRQAVTVTTGSWVYFPPHDEAILIVEETPEGEESQVEIAGETENVRVEDCYPLVSVGQMIKLLGRKIYFIMPEFNGKWLVRIFAGETSPGVLFKDIMAGDLTDALWQAVKEVL